LKEKTYYACLQDIDKYRVSLNRAFIHLEKFSFVFSSQFGTSFLCIIGDSETENKKPCNCCYWRDPGAWIFLQDMVI